MNPTIEPPIILCPVCRTAMEIQEDTRLKTEYLCEPCAVLVTKIKYHSPEEYVYAPH